MASSLPSHCLRRAHIPTNTVSRHSQTRHASLLRRPHIPYTFTQLVTLSDGSTYLTRSTSPAPIFKSTKDTRNHPMWQPTLDSLRNVEQDEAGRLRAFRAKFGRGWDLEGADDADGVEGVDGKAEGVESGWETREGDEGSLMDLISGASGNGKGANAMAMGEGKKAKEPVQPKEVKMVTIKQDGVLVRVPLTKAAEKRKEK